MHTYGQSYIIIIRELGWVRYISLMHMELHLMYVHIATLNNYRLVAMEIIKQICLASSLELPVFLILQIFPHVL